MLFYSFNMITSDLCFTGFLEKMNGSGHVLHG